MTSGITDHIPTTAFDDPALLNSLQYQLENGNNLTAIERANLLYKIGLCFIANGLFTEALDYCLQAKDLVMIEPPSWNRFSQHLSTLFDNIALLYLYHENYLKALTTWKKAIDIRSNFNYRRK
jgi:tetratricopeptide (TPR) repeat protein